MYILFRKSLICLLCFATVACTEKHTAEQSDPISFPYKFQSEIMEELESNTEPWKNQLAAWELSYIGEYEKALQVWDEGKTGGRAIDADKFQQFQETYQPKNALQYILNAADTAQVVIINEAHHQPYHRVFTTELLQDLYDKGYRYFGLETLDSQDQELNTRKYPVYQSGTYSREPQFGNLIRKALEIGYHLFPYESEGNGREREIGQAQKIQKQIQQDSTAKYLIHCGFAHAAEGEYKSWGKAMAGRLQEFTGINPLTINQTEFTETGIDTFANPIFQQLELSESSVFIDSNNQSFKHEKQANWFDILVFHPKTIIEDGRPNWIFRNEKQKIQIRPDIYEIEFPVLVFAFKEGEDVSRAVPFDLVYSADKQKVINLALEKGAYTIIIQNLKEKALAIKVQVE